jgi:hypothetical protein
LARVIIPAIQPKVVEWLEGTKIRADEELRKAITEYAQSGPKWVSKDAMEIWIESNLNNPDCKIPQTVPRVPR